jgi:uncharacterized membrane protein YjgN (DUF898 family)
MPKPKFPRADIGWLALFMVLFLPCISIGMFVFAAYLTPALLGSPNSLPRQGADSAIEFLMLFAGLALGMLVAIGIFCAFARSFLSEASHQRWAAQLENGQAHFSAVQLVIGRHVIRLTKPRGRSNAL